MQFNVNQELHFKALRRDGQTEISHHFKRLYPLQISAVQLQIQPPARQGEAHRGQERHGRPASAALPAGRPAGQRAGVQEGRADHQRPVPAHPRHDAPGDGQERSNPGQRAGLQEEAARLHGAARRHEGQVGQDGVQPAERGQWLEGGAKVEGLPGAE